MHERASMLWDALTLYDSVITIKALLLFLYLNYASSYGYLIFFYGTKDLRFVTTYVKQKHLTVVAWFAWLMTFDVSTKFSVIDAVTIIYLRYI